MEKMVGSGPDQVAIDTRDALESIRWFVGQAITTATVLSTASVFILGFAVENQQAGLLLVGAVASLILYISLRVALRGVLPYLLMVYEFDDGLVLLSIMNVEQTEEIKRIRGISSKEEKKMALHQLEKSLLRDSSIRIPPMLCLASAGIQIVMIPILVAGSDWSLL